MGVNARFEKKIATVSKYVIMSQQIPHLPSPKGILNENKQTKGIKHKKVNI